MVGDDRLQGNTETQKEVWVALQKASIKDSLNSTDDSYSFERCTP